MEQKPINRTGNPAGIYLTPSEYEANGFAGDNGFVYGVTTSVNNPYIHGASEVTAPMLEIYAKILKDNFSYGDSWVDDAIIPEFKKDGRFKDIPGWMKTKVMQAGGYDSWKDGPHLAVFDKNNVNITNKRKAEPAEYIAPKADYYKPSDVKDLFNHGKSTGSVDKKSVRHLMPEVTDAELSELEQTLNSMGIMFK